MDEVLLPTQEVNIDPVSIITAMKADLNAAAAVCTPEDYKFPFPPYYQYLTRVLMEAVTKERDFSNYAVGLPRGFAKTTWLKILAVCFILFSKKRFILIILATERMAENFISDIEDILSSPNIVALFGDWRLDCNKDTKTDKEFKLAGRSIKLTGMGAGSSLRGIVRNNKRPDVQLMDDIQTREDADSEIISEKLFNWMLGTLMYTQSPFGCQHIFVGNMYPTDHCILKKLRDSPDWLTFITGAILQDGTSLWPELHPIEQLYDELNSALRMGKSEIFMSEKMNDPSIIPKTAFDSTKVKTFTPAGELHTGNFILIDPSGMKKKSDKTAIGYFEIYEGKPHLRFLIKEILTPKQTIIKSIELCNKYKCQTIIVEDVAYQSTLLFWFNEILEKLKHSVSQITMLPINPGGTSKNSRILKMFNLLLAREITLDITLSSIVFSLIYKFDARKTNNEDDVLDILAYAPRVLELYGHIIPIPNGIPQEETLEIGVDPEHLTSAV